MKDPVDSNEDKSQNKSLDLGKATAEGATSLFLSKFGQQFVGIIGSIVLIRLLGSPSAYGFISAATTVPGLVMLGNLTGVSAGLARFLSRFKIERNSDSIWSLFWSATILAVITGVLLSITAFLAADPISAIIGKPLVDPFLKLASPLPFCWTLQLSIKQTMIALGRARVYSGYQILDEVLLSSFPIAAIALGYGTYGALGGMVLANFASWGVAMTLAISAIFQETESGKRNIRFVESARELVKFGMPQGISNSFSTFAGQVINLILLRYVSIAVYALYSVAVSAASFGTYVSDPISADRKSVV